MSKLNNFSSAQTQYQDSHFTLTKSKLLSRYQTFRDDEWEVVERTLSLLQASRFYWGALSVQEAHARLLQEPVGTYLLRDSSQGNCLFSLSVRISSGPVSLRISFQKGYFWLKDWFSDCVVRLLDLVVAGARTTPLYCDELGKVRLVFSEPLCREFRMVPMLQELCRKTLIASGFLGQSSPWNLLPCWEQTNSKESVADKSMKVPTMPIC